MGRWRFWFGEEIDGDLAARVMERFRAFKESLGIGDWLDFDAVRAAIASENAPDAAPASARAEGSAEAAASAAESSPAAALALLASLLDPQDKGHVDDSLGFDPRV